MKASLSMDKLPITSRKQKPSLIINSQRNKDTLSTQRISTNTINKQSPALSVYEQLLTSLQKKKASKPGRAYSRHINTQSKTDLQQLVTKVDDMIIVSSPQTEKSTTSRNKQFQFSNRIKHEPLSPQPLKLTPLSTRTQRSKRYYWDRVEDAFKILNSHSRMIRDHFFQTYQGLNLPLRPVGMRPHIMAPRSLQFRDKITLVFDLDETLVHCNDNLLAPHDVTLNIVINNNVVKAGINVRPHAHEILNRLKDDFEIIIFTASHMCYAQKVIDYLDPQGTIVRHRLFRDHCSLTGNGLYVKDLEILIDETRPLKQIVLIDNASYSYAWQPNNGIPIIPFYDDKSDKELLELEEYLRQLQGLDDVCEFNYKNLKLNALMDSKGPSKAFFNVFGYQP